MFVDDTGVYRCKGRLGNSSLPYETKCPVLLPQNNHLTSLIVRECHEKVLHREVKDTLTDLRCRYWIIKGRQTVKREIADCSTCLKVQGKVCRPIVPAELPDFTVEKDFAFANTGVDIAGPLYVKNVYGGDQKMYKVYIALFTCASSRAVHLDLVPTLESQTFIRCLKRFIARRGVNQLFVSDNAKTFKSRDVQDFAMKMGISWSSICRETHGGEGFLNVSSLHYKALSEENPRRSKANIRRITYCVSRSRKCFEFQTAHVHVCLRRRD